MVMQIKLVVVVVVNWDHVLQVTCGKIGEKHRVLLLIVIVNLNSFVMGAFTNYITIKTVT